MYIIGGTSPPINRVQRLNVSAFGDVTRYKQDGPQVPVESIHGASAVFDDYLKLISLTGGKVFLSGTMKFDLVWTLDLSQSSSSWDRGPDLLTGRKWHCSCMLGSIIYVIGGFSSNTWNKLDDVEMWDTSPYTSAQWVQVQAYPISVVGAACVSVQDEVWVSGGAISPEQTSTNAVYSWNSHAWTERPRMLTARKGHGMVTYGGHIWVISGEGEASVEVYDNIAWHVVSYLPAWRMYGASVLWGRTVIQVAGWGPNQNTIKQAATVYTMNITSSKWALSHTSIENSVYRCAVAFVIP